MILKKYFTLGKVEKEIQRKFEFAEIERWEGLKKIIFLLYQNVILLLILWPPV